MKKILIEDIALENLLEKRKNQIGIHYESAIADIFSGATLFFSSIPASYPSYLLDGKLWRFIFLLMGFLFSVRGLIILYKAHRHNYSHNKLYDEIYALNELQHPFSIVAVKDSFRKHPNRYLLHYEPDWKCDLFFSFRTHDNEEDNINNIKRKLSGLLNIDEEKILVSYKTERMYTKYSVRDKVTKMYQHKIYLVTISRFSKELRNDRFEMDGIQYKWMSIADMRKDPEIKQKNLDVVDLVDSYCS